MISIKINKCNCKAVTFLHGSMMMKMKIADRTSYVVAVSPRSSHCNDFPLPPKVFLQIEPIQI